MEQFANNATTTLSGAIDNVQTSLTVTDESSFSPDELMLVTAGAGTPNWTVTRGVEGTTAASHANGATVSQVLTAGALQQFRADNVQSNTVANLPANTQEGVTYWPTNGYLFYRDTGSVWQTFGPMWRFIPPDLGDFTWVNQGSATVYETNGGITIKAPAQAGTNIRALVQTMPATPYVLTVAFIPNVGSGNFANSGLITRDSTSGQLWTFGRTNVFGQIVSNNYTNATTYFSTNLSETHPNFNNPQWLQIEDDGTTATLRVSTDGYNWVFFASFLRDAFLTAPDQIGFNADAENASYDAFTTLLHWEIT